MIFRFLVNYTTLRDTTRLLKGASSASLEPGTQTALQVPFGIPRHMHPGNFTFGSMGTFLSAAG